MASLHENPIPGVLILEDPDFAEGRAFEGFLFGASVSASSIRSAQNSRSRIRDRGYGEVVFNTSMTGYQEILTDPSYYGQIVTMTTPHIGNTGVNLEDPESAHPWVGGFVIHEPSETPSNWRAMNSLDAYLKENQVPGIYGVDTRALTRLLRSRGVVRGVILPASERAEAARLLKELPQFEGRDLIGEVTTPEPYHWPHPAAVASDAASKKSPQTSTLSSGGVPSRKRKVVAVDFGVKWNLLRSLAHLGCEIEVVPAHESAEKILARKPDGVFLSNGPGDPAAAPYAVETVKKLVGKVPVFGVCMGHQILGLSQGARTYKLKFGHRGGNQPVLDRTTGKVEISSQNHGYCVDDSTLPAGCEVTHINLNDQTVEGIQIPEARAFSVQYHPESCPGSHDSRALFDRFIDLMDRK